MVEKRDTLAAASYCLARRDGRAPSRNLNRRRDRREAALGPRAWRWGLPLVLGLVLALLLGGWGGARPVHAASAVVHSVSVTVHAQGDAVTTITAPLPGVTFTVGDVTAEYWALGGGEAAQAQLATRGGGRPLATNTTGAAGLANFTGLAARVAGRPAVYRFAQTAGLRGYVSQVLVVPMPASGRLDLYPKASEQPRPATGGQAFWKVAAEAPTVGLRGAIFTVQNAAGQTLTRSGRWVVGRPTSWRRLTSAAQGRFAIDGLPAGHYWLREVRAPAGYRRAAHRFDFAVHAGIPAAATVPQRLTNHRRPPALPQTGGEWAAALSLIGLATVALLLMIQRHKEKTK